MELDLAAFGTDDITGSLIDTLNSEQPDTVLLQTPAVLEVVSIINPATVLRGEENVLDTLVIRNNGNATARITSATFNFLNGNNFYTQQVNSPSMPFDLAGGVTDTIEVSVNILTNAPLGIDSLAGAIQGIELNRNVVVGSTSEYITSWQVTGESSISILSVSTDRTLVSQGEDSLDVQARLLNQGTGTMTIDSLELQFSNGNGNYIISGPVPAPGFTLAAGRDTTMSFLVDVNGTATTGPDTIDARLVATEGTETFIIDGAINTDIWTVQNRPVVVIDSVTISPSVASTGQSGLSGRMVITNQTGTFRSSARIDSLDYNFLLGLDNVDTNFVINQITPPVLPFTLPAGASQAVNFNIGINSNALDTTYVADGTLSYVDINDDTRFTVSSANQQDTLLIQSTTTINILSLTVIPDTVSQGQNNVAGQLIYENAGSAELMVTTAQAQF